MDLKRKTSNGKRAISKKASVHYPGEKQREVAESQHVREYERGRLHKGKRLGRRWDPNANLSE